MNSVAIDSGWMREMFDSVPERYGLLNKVLTFGRDEKWRSSVQRFINPGPGEKILDICTGTGDLALRLAKSFPASNLYAVDFSAKMLYTAKERAASMGLGNIVFQEGDCRSLEFESGCFDYVTVSFGFRNLSYSEANLKDALREIHRILREGGRLAILETSQPPNMFIRRLFHLYVKTVVPVVGYFISREKKPYNYLGSSIVKFFDSMKLESILKLAGFHKEVIAPFMFGAIALSIFIKKQS